jgi:catechol 2,3-dioxygenase-like lactoylglutathione lyase family enzyme
MESTFSHVGICVSDLQRSVSFYCDALGFEKGESHSIGPEFAPLMDLENVTLTSQFIRKGTTTIELLGFEDPVPYGDRVRRPLPQLGITHFSFRVNDVEAAAAKVVEHGGTVVETSRTTLGPLEFVYCTDPDGVRIELMDLGT